MEWEPGIRSATLATKVHRLNYDMLGVDDPYAELKREANQVAFSLLPRGQELVEASEDRLTTACLVAIAGNVMDFGIGGFESPQELRSTFDSLVAEAPEPNDVPRMREILKGAKEVVYLFDNCGEIVLDVPLLKELKGMGLKVTGVVKGEPIITDATWEDLSISGVDRLLDERLTTGRLRHRGRPGPGAEGTVGRATSGPTWSSPRAWPTSRRCPAPGCEPIAHLLRSKCQPVSEAIGAKKDRNVIRIFE